MEGRGITRLSDIEPTMIAFYIEKMQDGYSKSSVKGPKLTIVKGKTPVLQPADARLLLDSIVNRNRHCWRSS